MLYLVPFIFLGAFPAILPFILPTIILEHTSYALSLKNDNYDGWVYYGQVVTKYGGPFRAYEAVAQVTKMRSERPEAWQKMGDLFSKMGQYEAAEKANEFADETLDSHGGLLWTI